MNAAISIALKKNNSKQIFNYYKNINLSAREKKN